MNYCSRHFKKFKTNVDGNCYFCCKWWNKSYCLGNIFTQTPKEIWNGQAAQKLKRSIIDGDYKYELITDYPREISICYDYTGTACCVFCNDFEKKMLDNKAKQWDKVINAKLILKNLKSVQTLI